MADSYADVEIRIRKQEPGKGYPIEIRVDGLAQLLTFFFCLGQPSFDLAQFLL